MTTDKTRWKMAGSALLVAGMVLAACGSDATDDPIAAATEANTDADSDTDPGDSGTANDDDGDDAGADVDESAGGTSSFQIEVWADNWMAVYVDGELIGEDSVSITTERSFNAETFTFEATYPFTVAIEAKDFMETDSGIEYIGEQKQQMGDGGIIAQITDTATGEVVAATDSSWRTLVIHRAPLNTDCVRDTDPDVTCEFESVDAPSDWETAEFDDAAWSSATEWTAADVGPKDGYDEIDWDGTATLVWGTDLEVDNTVLLRATVSN